MILEIDMGNTRLKWRIRNRRASLAQGFIGVEAPLEILTDKLGLYRGSISAVFVASVVGELLEQRLKEWSICYLALQPQFARTNTQCGPVLNGYREPQLLGVDRWLGIITAYRLVNGACVVVSCGTAVTVDLMTQNGRHLGGFIAPGLNLMLDSLTAGTRKIKVGGSVPALSLSPATATSDAVYSACAAMLTGLIDNGVRQLRKLDPELEIHMIFTGGDAAKLLFFYPQARLVPDLVLDGLACVLDYPQ